MWEVFVGLEVGYMPPNGLHQGVSVCKQLLMPRKKVPKQTKPLENFILISFLFFFFLCFLGPHLWPKEVTRLGIELELQLLAYATVIATQNLSRLCDLHRSLRRHRILNLLSGTGDQTCVPMDTSQVFNLLHHNGNSLSFLKLSK